MLSGKLDPTAFLKTIPSAIARNWLHVALTVVVFALFVLNAGGAFELILDLDVGGGAITFPAIIQSPEFVVLLCVGLLLSVLLPVLTPINASMLTLVCMLPVFYLGYQVHTTPTLVPMEYSLLTILMIFVVNVLISYFTETKRKQALITAFGQYIPPEVAREISDDPRTFSTAGEARELSVMFCDVHNFTTISEGLEPRELARLLNALFTPLSRILSEHHGIIDKYMGDAIMAFWGAPVPDAYHAANAIAAAFEMQEEMVRLRRQFSTQGWPEIDLGIGINTGVMAVGNMGSKYRMAYTVVGDSVNVASRLQDLTRVYRARVIVGEKTRRAFPAVTYRELGLVQVKGKSELARIYEPCNPATDPESTIIANMHRHNEALRCYYGRKWNVAEELFGLLKEEHPNDALYDYYIGRILEFKTQPPPEGWRGEIRFSVK